MKIPVMLDSGAYSALTQRKPIALREYIDFCGEMVPRFRKAGIELTVVNLDDPHGDGSTSYENWLEMRRNGLCPLPMWHVHTSRKYLYRYMEHSAYIGLGGVGRQRSVFRRHASAYRSADGVLRAKGASTRLATYDRVFTSAPGVRFHFMACMIPSIVLRYPVFSVDGTRWLLESAWGTIPMPRLGSDGQWDYLRRYRQLYVSDRQRDKPDHLLNLPPAQRRRVVAYLVSIGLCQNNKPAEVVLNERDSRCIAAVRYWEGFARQINERRQFASSSILPTLFGDVPAEQSGRFPFRLYLSGEVTAEKWIRSPDVGVLFSYFYIRGKGAAHNRFMSLLEGVCR